MEGPAVCFCCAGCPILCAVLAQRVGNHNSRPRSQTTISPQPNPNPPLYSAPCSGSLVSPLCLASSPLLPPRTPKPSRRHQPRPTPSPSMTSSPTNPNKAKQNRGSRPKKIFSASHFSNALRNLPRPAPSEPPPTRPHRAYSESAMTGRNAKVPSTQQG